MFIHTLTKQTQYVARILRDYKNGKENAFETYLQVYGESHPKLEDESDIDYIIRCAEQDYEDGVYQGAVYQDYYDALLTRIE